MNALTACLLVSTLLFSIGLAAVLTRSHAVLVLLGVELMLNAANINFVAFWKFGSGAHRIDGLVFVLFSIAIAASEAAVGLALVIALYRHRKSIRLNQDAELKG